MLFDNACSIISNANFNMGSIFNDHPSFSDTLYAQKQNKILPNSKCYITLHTF